ncbi:MAG TPA: hypothetical protein VGC54_10580 [Planctomycetota bacterium]
MTTKTEALEGLLEICDQIRDLQEDSLRDSGSRLRGSGKAEETVARVRVLREAVFAELPALAGQPAAKALSDAELLLLALLFHRRISGRSEGLRGGELVSLLTQAGFSRGKALAALDREAALRHGSWLAVRTDSRRHDPLDLRFEPTAMAMDLFMPAVPVPLTDAPEAPPDQPFRSEEEYFWDLLRWRNLCIQRAEALFEGEWPASAPSQRLVDAGREARAAHLRLRARLGATKGSSEYVLESFRREHQLGTDHMLLVMHLLFSETLEGESFLAASECLRLISDQRTDLFLKRRIVGPRGRLRREGTVLAGDDGSEHARAMAHDLYLAEWAVESLLAGLHRRPALEDRDFEDLARGE